MNGLPCGNCNPGTYCSAYQGEHTPCGGASSDPCNCGSGGGTCGCAPVYRCNSIPDPYVGPCGGSKPLSCTCEGTDCSSSNCPSLTACNLYPDAYQPCGGREALLCECNGEECSCISVPINRCKAASRPFQPCGGATAPDPCDCDGYSCSCGFELDCINGSVDNYMPCGGSLPCGATGDNCACENFCSLSSPRCQNVVNSCSCQGIQCACPGFCSAFASDCNDDPNVCGGPKIHDVAVMSMSLLKTVVGQGYLVKVDVSITNQGHFSETFNVIAHADLALPVGDEVTMEGLPVVNLEPGETRHLLFQWDTTNCEKGNYIVSAVADLAPGEVDTSDNILIGDSVSVTTPGDVNGDAEVNRTDLSDMSTVYGKKVGEPDWNANCDINDDNQVDVFDLFIHGRNFESSYAQKPIAVIYTDPDPPIVSAGTDLWFYGTNSYDPDGQVTAYFFDFGDGSNSGWLSSPASSTSHHYEIQGQYLARLKVRDNDGLESNWCAPVDVTVVGDGLVGLWKFDEGSGSTAYDSSRNGNNGIIHTATRTTGMLGNALQFNGVDSWVEIPSSPTLTGLSQITLEAWIKEDSITDQLKGIISKCDGQAPPTNAEYFLGTNEGGKVFFETDNGEAIFSAQSTQLVTEAGRWYHVAGTWSGDSYTIYVDGVPVLSGTSTAQTTLSNTLPVQIGRHGDWSWVYFQGTIDEVGIYNYARTAEEIRNDYEFGTSTSFENGFDGWQTSSAGGAIVQISTSYSHSGVHSLEQSCPTGGTGGSPPFSEASATFPATTFLSQYEVSLSVYVTERSDASAASQFGFLFGNEWVLWDVWGSGSSYVYVRESEGYQRLGDINNPIPYGLPLNTWHRVRVIAYSTTGAISVWLDENLVVNNWFAFNAGEKPDYYYIHAHANYPEDFVHHFVDDVHVSEEERPPVGYWKFDEGSGNIAYDSSGNGNQGALVSDPRWVHGIKGNALSFDGLASHVDVLSSSSLVIHGNQVSSEMWMKPAFTLNDSTPTMDPLIKGNEYTFTINHDITDGKIWFHVGIATPDYFRDASVGTTTNQWMANTWYHVAGTYDGISLKIYVNGVLENSVSESGNLWTQEPAYEEYPLSIAAYTIGPGHYGHLFFFNGTIDEVKIYNYARTAQEVMDDYISLATLQMTTLSVNLFDESGFPPSSVNGVNILAGVPISIYTLENTLVAVGQSNSSGTASFNLEEGTYKLVYGGAVLSNGARIGLASKILDVSGSSLNLDLYCFEVSFHEEGIGRPYELNYIDLDVDSPGNQDAITVQPGQQVNAEFSWWELETVNGPVWFVSAFGSWNPTSALGNLASGVASPSSHNLHTIRITFTAPTTPGTYEVRLVGVLDFDWPNSFYTHFHYQPSLGRDTGIAVISKSIDGPYGVATIIVEGGS